MQTEILVGSNQLDQEKGKNMSEIQKYTLSSVWGLFRESVPEHSLLTVCDRDEAKWEIEKSDGSQLFLCLKQYSDEVYQKIQSEADAWRVKKEIEEYWDYDFYANCGGFFTSFYYNSIEVSQIVVKDDLLLGFAMKIKSEPSKMVLLVLSDMEKESPYRLYSYSEEPRSIEFPYITYSYYLEKNAGDADAE